MPVPDQHIHETATGAALKTVEAHSEQQDLVNPYKKEEHFLAINPKGLVPAIEYKGRALYESLVLCEFIQDAYPEHGLNILPTDPFERARVRLWVDHVSKAVIPASQEAEKQDTTRKELYKALSDLSAQVKGPWFTGEDFGLVDIAIAPWTARDYIASENRGYVRGEVGNGWKEWAERLEARDSVVKTTSEKQYYAEIYGRYLRDEAQSEAAKATRAGRVIP
ncbi:hypothetical protein HWV62_11740 [Athelia sp. TMB]|nr:hypothetical protein HWV62_30017 [Athelia sp. TMB]KAF7984767.1 hypothetical protein HWV62_11740 [Athelia sp. TMB]